MRSVPLANSGEGRLAGTFTASGALGSCCGGFCWGWQGTICLQSAGPEAPLKWTRGPGLCICNLAKRRTRVRAAVPSPARCSPLYNWRAMEENGFKWWAARMRRAFDLYDEFRIDHFRGLAGYWSIPAGSETAMDGTWVVRAGQLAASLVQQSVALLMMFATSHCVPPYRPHSAGAPHDAVDAVQLSLLLP